MKKYNKVVLKKQDPSSKLYFSSERKYLLVKLDKKLIFDILHIGSTAIPGMKGKGIIDIYLIAKNKGDVPKLLEQIDSNTNYIRPKVGGSKERIFQRRERKIKGKKVIFHLHVSWRNANEWKDDILFLKYLLKHPEAAKRYEELKYIWAKRANYIKEKYRKSKHRFVNPILKKVKKEIKRI